MHFSRKFGEEKSQLMFKTFELLENYNWPGNIRELSNTIERLYVLSDGDSIGPEDLPETFFKPQLNGNVVGPNYSCDYDSFMSGLNEYVADQESKYILKKLNELGSVRALAKYLDMPRTNLQRKLKSLGYYSNQRLGEAQC